MGAMRFSSLLVFLLLLGGFPLPAEDDTVVDAGGDEQPAWLTGEQEDEDAAAIRATREFDARRDEEVSRAQEEVRRRDAARRAAQEQTPRRTATEQPLSSPVLPRRSAAPGQARAAEAPGTPILLPDADEHVISQSGYFSVSGADSLRLGAIATHADEVRGRLLALLGLEPDVRCKVSIRLLGRATDTPQPHPIRTRIRILDGQPHFQIRIYPGGWIDLQPLDGALMSMVLCERALRALEPGAIPDVVALPDWLVTGLYQAVAWRSNKVTDREL